MKMDFSRLNLAYLINARDLARQDPDLVAALLDVPSNIARLLADVTPDELSQIAHIKTPLLVLRREFWWWQRLFNALRDGRPDELQAIIEHAGLITAPARKVAEE